MRLPQISMKNLVIAGILMIVCITGYFLIGLPFLTANQTGVEMVSHTTTPLLIDTSFEIQEADVSIVRHVNSTSVSFEQLQIIPEIERSLHGVDRNPEAWHQGWRLVKNLEGNISQYNTFVDVVCSGKTRIECNGGMLFEYHNQYYRIMHQEYGILRRSPDQ